VNPQPDELVGGSVVPARMLVGTDREWAEIAAIEMVLVELLLLASVGGGEEQAPMIFRPRERPRIGRRRLDPLELPRPRPVERQSARVFGELWPQLEGFLGAQIGADLELLLTLRILFVGRQRWQLSDLREDVAALLRRLVLPVHERDRCLGQPLDRDAPRCAARRAGEARHQDCRQDREPHPGPNRRAALGPCPHENHPSAPTAHARASSRCPTKGCAAFPVGSNSPTSCTPSPSNETTICAASGNGKSGCAAKARSSCDR
jgi:hypothetical protein